MSPDALESSGPPLDDYAIVVCPEMSGNSLWSETWGGLSGNVWKCLEIRAEPYARQNGWEKILCVSNHFSARFRIVY